MIESIVFDIGGVLAYDVWEYLLLDEQRGVAAKYDLDRDVVFKFARELWLQFECRPAHSTAERESYEREYWASFLERFKINLTIEDLIARTDEFIRPVEGMRELLAQLKARGHTLVICSDNNEFWFPRQAKKIGLDGLIDQNRIILSQHIGASKLSPNFEMFNAAVKAAGVDKTDCVLIDDRTKNIARAMQFGLPSILFPAHADHYGAEYLRKLFEKMELL
ncbi:MAG: HAD-IA family hydrolase [Chloroflexi bacterium]|nr:HAD-IA family hydrolase [Chloroflexota bacterium]MBI5712086.1 HAD-IA family hydrolase [Chloroflexota bacterium]